MAPAPRNLVTSASNIKRKEDCPSTLRARLRDEPPAKSSSVKPVPYQNVYQQVHASLGNHLDGLKHDRTVAQDPESNDPATQLQEAYARMGLSLHSSATEHLVEAHAEVQAKTKSFSEESSKTLAQNRDLYDNIAHPLSATLCHSEDHPRASVAVHLNRLKQDIAAAREEIVRLGTEWEECCRTEEAAWNEFKSGIENHGRGPSAMYEEAKTAAEEFKQEARAIVEANCLLLDEVDEDFKQKIQDETQKIMASLLAGI